VCDRGRLTPAGRFARAGAPECGVLLGGAASGAASRGTPTGRTRRRSPEASAAGTRRAGDDRTTSVAPPVSARAGSGDTCRAKAGSGVSVGSADAAAGAAGAGTGAASGTSGVDCCCGREPASSAVGSSPSSGATTRACGAEAGAGAAGDVTAAGAAAGAAGVAGVAAGDGGGIGAGRNESGSRYPCGSEVTRTPMYTYGTSSSGVPLGPTVPTASPSETLAPFFTAAEPRCVSVTECPSPVATVTLKPLVGTLPANVTVPDTGATTVVPAPAPMSMPRCCPPAYGWSGSNEKPVRTGPRTGHVHAYAAGADTRSRETIRAMRRMCTPSLSELKTASGHASNALGRCQR
jgi:hypothetical protein